MSNIFDGKMSTLLNEKTEIMQGCNSSEVTIEEMNTYEGANKVNNDFILSTLMNLFGVFSLTCGFKLFTKKRFMEDKNWVAFREFTPLPAIANYWLIKAFVIFSSTIVIYLGGYGMGIFP